MPFRRNAMVRRVLSGLLVLIVILLPVGRAGILTSPVFAAAPHAASAGHADEHPGLMNSMARDASGSPRGGCDHPDGYACCPSCDFLLGNLPSIRTVSVPLAAASLRYLMLSTAPLDSLSSAPNLPPPRNIA